MKRFQKTKIYHKLALYHKLSERLFQKDLHNKFWQEIMSDSSSGVNMSELIVDSASVLLTLAVEITDARW